MRRLILVVALVLAGAGAAAAKDYSAERYDVTMRVMPNGSVQVTETVRLRFSGGPFTHFDREIPTRKTDGIEVLGASMDGRVLPRGTDPGTFDVRRRESRVAVRWRFAGTTDAAHDFRVSYLMRGVVQQAGPAGRLEWQALPGEHPYHIAASRIVVAGTGSDRAPTVTTRRVAEARVVRSENDWVVEARDIGSNGWIAVQSSSPLASGATPGWQARERRRQALAPRLIQAGIVAAMLSLGLVLLLWRQYPAPPMMDEGSVTTDAPPLLRAPAIAAAVLAGGHASNAHAPATLFDLASRGLLTIAEGERQWKTVRRFTLTRGQPGTLAPHEAALLDTMLRDAQSVDFSKAASRLARRGRPFRHAVNEELHRLGLTDDQRRAARRRLLVAGFAIAALSIVATVLTLVTFDAGPWGLAVPIGMDLAAMLALAVGATRAELSDEGFRERERWRAFKRALKDEISRGSTRAGSADPQREFAPVRYLPYVAALGLVGSLARLLKTQGAEAVLPPWFRSTAGGDGSAAFVSFINTTTAGSSGGVGSGAAGGGSSSAG